MRQGGIAIVGVRVARRAASGRPLVEDVETWKAVEYERGVFSAHAAKGSKVAVDYGRLVERSDGERIVGMRASERATAADDHGVDRWL